MIMDFTTGYFGKSIKDISYQDVASFFTEPRTESDKIEFKSYSTTFGNLNKSFDGINRGICAFLNSEGGILIFGAPQGVLPPDGKEKIYQGTLTPVNEFWEQDRIINKISDSITPMPVGINVAILNEGANYMYVFEIQQSNYNPHQFQNTYYARLDGQTRPAPHYLIEALFRKIKYPNIEGYIKLEKLRYTHPFYYLDISIAIFNFSPLQNEENVSFRLTCSGGSFTKAIDTQYQNLYTMSGHQLVKEPFIDVLHFGTPHKYNETLMFNSESVLYDADNEVYIVLSFGGKYSPAKTSTYKLDFRKINGLPTTNPNGIISFIEENILYSERIAALGTTREKVLKEFLGR